MTPDLKRKIVREAITRNVDELLRKKPVMAYMEPDDQVSAYRVRLTFEASITSYRTMMFCELFRAVLESLPARSLSAWHPNAVRTGRLVQIRDALFLHHGGPPPGMAEKIAARLRQVQTYTGFPQFIRHMGLTLPPDVKTFSAFLRSTVNDSMRRGFSRPRFQDKGDMLLAMRKLLEPNNPGLPPVSPEWAWVLEEPPEPPEPPELSESAWMFEE